MKKISIITIFTVALLYSCGSKKAAVNQEELITDIKSYVTSVDNNEILKKEVTEGALTDAEGFKDIGAFKYTVYFDEKTKELIKIENVEKTDNTINETYYFKENELVYLKSVLVSKSKKLYLKKGRVVSEENTTSEDQQLLIDKANRFYKMFNKTH